MPRQRSKSEGPFRQPFRIRTLNETTGISTFSDSTTLQYIMNKTMTDVVTPNFYKRIKAGEIINNPTSLVSSETAVILPGYMEKLKGTARSFYNENGSGSLEHWAMTSQKKDVPPIPIGDLSYSSMQDLVREAESRAVAAMDQTPYKMLEDFFEIKQALALFKDPLAAFLNLEEQFWRTVRKKHFQKTGPDLIKAIADTWLTSRFAIMPAVRSMHDIIESLIKEKAEILNRATARGKVEYQASKADVYTGPIAYGYKFDRWSERRIVVRAGILYTLSDIVDDWRHTYGFRDKDVPEALWAIVPLSFMYDRVFNMSRTIRAMTNVADGNLSALACWTTIKNSLIHKTALTMASTGGQTISLVPGLVVTSNFSYTRVPWKLSVDKALPPIRGVRGLVSDATRIADLLSLVIQRRRRETKIQFKI